MAGFDAYLKAFAALTCITFALVVLAGGRRRGAPLHLATFLLLIAGNQAVETLRGLTPDGPADIFWWRVASIFAALDPLALYLFAVAVVPGRASPATFRAVFAGSVALAFASLLLGTSDAATRLVTLGLLSFTAATYGLVTLRFLHALSRDPTSARLRVLFTAAAVATVLPWVQFPYPIVSIVRFDIFGAAPGDRGHPLAAFQDLMSVLAWLWVLVLIGAVVLHARRLENGPATAKVALGGLLIGYVVAAALGSSTFATIHQMGRPLHPEPSWLMGLEILGRASAAVRWILFGGLVSAAIIRDDMLGMSLAKRRTSARGLVALAMGGALGLAYAALVILFGPESLELRPLDWLLLGVVLLATQGFRPLIDRVAERAYGVPMRSDRSGAHDAYRRAVTQLVQEGRDVRSDPEIQRLRRELGLGHAEAGVLERVAEETHSGPLVAGQRVGGRYLVRHLVGRGGAGRVFLARDETLARDVVLKEVLHDEPDDDAALREARAAGVLQHPNVVVVHDVIRRAGSSLLVVEYVPTGSLAERVSASGRIPPAEGARLLEGILAGLEAVHAHGLVHRDLKPENILLAADGTPKIADFGIARARRGVTARFDEPDAFAGTPEFMAPEQRAGARATPATDVYAVGAIARACLAHPLPPGVEAVVSRALAAEPQERFASAREMRLALHEGTLRA